jgi:hypothetical protein
VNDVRSSCRSRHSGRPCGVGPKASVMLAAGSVAPNRVSRDGVCVYDLGPMMQGL